MKLSFIACFAIVSVVGATVPTPVDNVNAVVNNCESDFKNFIINGISKGCDLFARIYYTKDDVVEMIQDFAQDIMSELSEIKAALEQQIPEIFKRICRLYNELGVSTYIGNASDKFVELSKKMVDFLNNLIGKSDNDIHTLFCGDKPEALTSIFNKLCNDLVEDVHDLNLLLSTFCPLPS